MQRANGDLGNAGGGLCPHCPRELASRSPAHLLCSARCWIAVSCEASCASLNAGMPLVCYFCPNRLPNVEKISSGRYRDAKHTMLVAVHLGAGIALAMAVCYHRLSRRIRSTGNVNAGGMFDTPPQPCESLGLPRRISCCTTLHQSGPTSRSSLAHMTSIAHITTDNAR